MCETVSGKSVIVTGGSKGIGKGIAAAFASKGASVLIVARGEESARSAAAELRADGGRAEHFIADVGNWDEVQAMVEHAERRFGRVDVLCANAGIFPSAKILEMDPAEWDRVLNTNLKSTFMCVKAVTTAMQKQGQGRIIVTSSITGPLTGFPGWAHYGASKAGQLGFVRTAAIELAKYKITINAILPGNILTEGLADLGDEYLKTMAASIPLGRLGLTEDVGNAALFLASREASFITGQAIVVDGGQTLPESLEALESV